MAGFFDGLQNTMMNPLFLGGASLLSGEGMSGAMRGMQMGSALAQQRKQMADEEARKAQFQGLLADPSMAQKLPPEYLRLAQMAGPEAGIGMLAKRMDPMADIERKKAEAELGMMPLEGDYKRAQIAKMRAEAAGEGSDFGKAGTIVQDKNGDFYSVQFGSNGQKKVEPLRLGETGLSPSRGTATIDTGTGTQIIDKATGLPVRNVDKQLLEAERQKQLGEMTGKQDASAPGDLAAADEALKILDKIEMSPGLDVGTGASSIGNYIWGTQGYDFQNMVDQAKSGAFLTAIQQMRGLGSLSNAEGDTATKAVTRMNTATSKEAFLEAARDYRAIVIKGRERAAARISKGTSPQPQAVPAAPQNNGWAIERLD